MVPKLPDPPLKAFLVQVKAEPGPTWSFDPPGNVAGFYQLLGMTVHDETHLQELARAELSRDGAKLTGIEDVWVPDFEASEAGLADVITDTRRPGIWYKSGRAFYGPENEKRGSE